jgi:hypothetical protein
VIVHFRPQISSAHEYCVISNFNTHCFNLIFQASNTHHFKLIFQASMSLSPDSSCVSSEKESAVDAESENGAEELRAEQNMPPLTGLVEHQECCQIVVRL